MASWTRGAIAAAALGALLNVPGLARANSLRISSYEMNDLGGTVQLESNAPIGVPWVRMDARSVKIWFPDVTEIARFDHSRDANEAIRVMQLKLAAADSAVLRVELGAGRTLSQDDVQVTRNGASATIKVRAQPSAAPAPAQAPVVAAQPGPGATAGVAVAPTAKSPPTAAVSKDPASSRPSTASQSPTEAAPAPVAVATAEPRPLGLARPDSPAAKPGPGQSNADAPPAAKPEADPSGIGLATAPGSNLGGLIAISLVLLAVYGALRVYGKKRVQLHPDIQVVSSRRVGHRQELMVVRALGADHLLVCSGGKIERVTSVPTPVLAPSEPAPTLSLALPPEATPPAAAPTAESSQAGGLGVFSMLSSRSRLRRLLDAVEQQSPAQVAESTPAPAPQARTTARPTFGPELLNAIHSHKLTSLSALPQIAPLAARESEAVAGIQRLRARGDN